MLLRENAAFRRYWTAHSVSMLGDQVTGIALPLLAVLALHATAAEMGYLAAMQWLPYLLFALVAGAWVDRRQSRRHVMMVADLGRALLLLTVPAAALLGLLTLVQALGVAFCVGVLSVLFNVADSALFVSLVPRERFLSGSSLLNGSRALSFVLGPSLGGVLVQLLTAPFTMLVDVLSYLGSALCLARIAPEEPPRSDGGWKGAWEGLRFTWRTPTVRMALISTAVINLFNLMFSALLVLYATRSLGVAPGVLGVVLGSGAVGGVLGAAFAGRIASAIGVGPAYLAGCVVFTAPLLLVPLAGGPHLLVLAMLFGSEFLSGFGVVLLDIAIGSVFAAVIPGSIRARVSGAYTVVNYGVRPIGSLAGGLVATAIGVRTTLWIAGVLAIVGVVAALPSPIPRMRELPPLVDDR